MSTVNTDGAWLSSARRADTGDLQRGALTQDRMPASRRARSVAFASEYASAVYFLAGTD